MDLDDLEPRRQPSKQKDLTIYSIEDLQRYVDLLKAEVIRAEAMITQKAAQKNDASSIFKA